LLHHSIAQLKKDIRFLWDSKCEKAFQALKAQLVQAPVLAYHCFKPAAKEFILQTDTSAVGLGAILEQNGHALAYDSYSLTSSERNYSNTAGMPCHCFWAQAILPLSIGEIILASCSATIAS